MQTTDTIGRVPRPRGVLSEQTLNDLMRYGDRRRAAEAVYRKCVVRALAEGSYSAVAEATGLSKDTLQRWKKEASK